MATLAWNSLFTICKSLFMNFCIFLVSYSHHWQVMILSDERSSFWKVPLMENGGMIWLSSEYHSPQLTDAGSGQSWASGGITGAPTDWTHVRQPLVAGDNNINMYHVSITKYVLVDLMEQFYFKQKEIWVQITCNDLRRSFICFMDVGKLLISCQNCSREGVFWGVGHQGIHSITFIPQYTPSSLYFSIMLLNCKC